MRDSPILQLAAFLTLIFVTLKVTDQIDWGWGWVLMPLWIIPAVVVSSIIVVFVEEGIHRCIDALEKVIKR